MKKFLEKIKNAWNIDHEKIEVQPIRDWKRAVGTFFALLLISGAVHAYLYNDWLSGGTSVSVETELPVIDVARLSVAVDSYEQRLKTFESSNATGTKLVDPSL